jgi:hypothetical protein
MRLGGGRLWTLLLVSCVAVLLIVAAVLANRPSMSRARDVKPVCVASDVRKTIDAAFAEMARIENIPHGRTYRLAAHGKTVAGQGGDFLRRRTGPEVLSSGLSSGCGDFAVAFLYLMEQCGFKTLFVDSAEISTQSLKSHFSGHAVVAVRDEPNGRWILADPTARRIISENWSTSDKTFYGRYWIGFCGPLSGYPVHDPESLRQFYGATLKSIPAEVLNRHLFRFRFTVDRSLIGGDGKYLNRNLSRLLANNGKALERLGIHPEKEINILLVKGANEATSSLEYSEKLGWVCTLGLQSGCSPSFVAYLEGRVARRLNETEIGSVPSSSLRSSSFPPLPVT